MTNRPLICIVKNQKPLTAQRDTTVRDAALAMSKSNAGSVLVVDSRRRLCGIFTGRDAVRFLAGNRDAGSTLLAKAMTPDPVGVTPGGRAIDALRAMDAGGFRHVPVTLEGRIIGIVSLSDFKGMELEVFNVCARGRGASSPAERSLGEIVSSQEPVVVTTAASVQEACKEMWQRKVGCVLVVDGSRRLKGIFTGRDAVRVLAKAKDPAGMRVSKAMTREPVTLPSSAHAIYALRAMNDRGFRHMPVVDDGKVRGVVSRNDFTSFELDRLEEEEHLKECIW